MEFKERFNFNLKGYDGWLGYAKQNKWIKEDA